MEKELKVQIITLSGTVLDVMCRSVQLPLYQGLAGILPGHAPMLALLERGVVRCTGDFGTRYAAVSAGTVQVANNCVTLLADDAREAQSATQAQQLVQELNNP